MVDGVPDVIIVPYLFVEYFQTLDDYANKPYFATFTRWLKYLAFFVSIFLPGLYVAMGTFNPELFPEKLLSKIAVAVSETPFNLMIEALIIHFHLFFQEVSLHPGLQPAHQGSEAIRQKSAVMYFQDPALSSGRLLSVSRSSYQVL